MWCDPRGGGGANRLSLPPINSFLFPTPRVKKIALRAPTFPQAESQEMKWDILFFYFRNNRGWGSNGWEIRAIPLNIATGQEGWGEKLIGFGRRRKSLRGYPLWRRRRRGENWESVVSGRFGIAPALLHRKGGEQCQRFGALEWGRRLEFQERLLYPRFAVFYFIF